MTPLRIGYFGDGPWSHLAFDMIIENLDIEIAFVCARFDSPDPELKSRAQRCGIEFLTHPKVNSSDFINLATTFKCDLFVSMSFNQIFRKPLFDLPRLTTINCHAGKLPFYRGRNVLNWALINDEKEIGVTVHFVDEGIDTGDIVIQRTFDLSDEDDYASVLKRAVKLCAECLYDAIIQINSGTFTRTPQCTIDEFGSYCARRSIGDERIDWSKNSRQIFNFVRALCAPGPQATSAIDGIDIKINKISYREDASLSPAEPGTIIEADCDSISVKSVDGFIELIEWHSDATPQVADRLI